MNAPNGQPIAELFQDHARLLATKMSVRLHLAGCRRARRGGVAYNEAEHIRLTSWVLASERDVMDAIQAHDNIGRA